MRSSKKLIIAGPIPLQLSNRAAEAASSAKTSCKCLPGVLTHLCFDRAIRHSPTQSIATARSGTLWSFTRGKPIVAAA